MTPNAIGVEWSARFRAYMTWLRKFADAKPRGAHATILHGLERISSTLVADPVHCFAGETELRDDLRGIRRRKFLERGRLFYIASEQKRSAIILHFGDMRKAGDPKRDAYAEFRKLVRSSEFDLLFAKLGIQKPEA